MFLQPAAWSTKCSVNGGCARQVHSQTCPGVEVSIIIRMHARRQRKPTKESRAQTCQRSVYHTFVPAIAPANHTSAGTCSRRYTVNPVTTGDLIEQAERREGTCQVAKMCQDPATCCEDMIGF